MAYTIPCESDDRITVEEYVDYVGGKLDLRDEAAIAASAPLLQALANDRDLIVRRLNELIRQQFRTGQVPSVQAIFLGGNETFYVRANIWPSTADIVAGRVFQGQFSYDLAHDHNFSFLTVTYSGPGYETDIYEYDYDALTGYPGEPVDIRPLERVRFSKGTAMLYRASRDVHVQHPPKEMSITLNLMVSLPEHRAREQYFFDLEQGRIGNYPPENDNSKRAAFFRIAAELGDGNTAQLFSELMSRHPAARARLAAADALDRMEPGAGVWDQVLKDPSPLVVREARLRLDGRSA